MLTVGVDLAAEAAGTAVATLDWSGPAVTVTDLRCPAEDDGLVEAILRAGATGKVGIDCPLGWPDAFVTFVNAHRAGHVTVPAGEVGRDWRRRLAYRVTDEVVRASTGLIPLSVAADRIGHTAMRCAGLLARLAAHGIPVDRSGAAVVVEVYPAASLKSWGLPFRRYKSAKHSAARFVLVDGLLAAAPWLRLGAYEALCRTTDHALDAVVSALSARAAQLGQATRPDRTQVTAARTEGWIAVPAAPLHTLHQISTAAYVTPADATH